jgi:hypothetical protein
MTIVTNPREQEEGGTLVIDLGEWPGEGVQQSGFEIRRRPGARLVRAGAGMPSGRVAGATDVPAGQALSQVQPPGALSAAAFAACRRARLNFVDLAQVSASCGPEVANRPDRR